MKYIYAALLLHEEGKEINEENLKKVIGSVGEVDEARVKVLIEGIKGVNIDDVIKQATTMPISTEKVEAEEEKKEEAEEEKKEEMAAEGLAALFG